MENSQPVSSKEITMARSNRSVTKLLSSDQVDPARGTSGDKRKDQVASTLMKDLLNNNQNPNVSLVPK